MLEFANGAIGTIITSFDVWAAELPRIEIYGTEGTLSVPDPNTFGGPVRVRRAGASEWSEIPLTHGYAENSRGIGVADMAYALRSGRAAPRQRRPGLPRPRHHARRPRRRRCRTAGDAGEHLRAPCRTPARSAEGAAGRIIDEFN